MEQSHDGPENRNQVDMQNEADVRWWCKILGVTEEELRRTVQDVGSDAAEVRSHLRK